MPAVDLVERDQVVGRRLPRPGLDVGDDLLGFGRAGDDARDRGLGREAADRDVEDAQVALDEINGGTGGFGYTTFAPGAR